MSKKDLEQASGAILASFVALHYIEEVSHTKMFQKDLKFKLKKSIEALQKVEKNFYDKIESVDDHDLASHLSHNMITFLETCMKNRLFNDFTAIQEIIMAYDLDPKSIKGISDKIHNKNNALNK
jgi:hypothetical protein